MKSKVCVFSLLTGVAIGAVIWTALELWPGQSDHGNSQLETKYPITWAAGTDVEVGQSLSELVAKSDAVIVTSRVIKGAQTRQPVESYLTAIRENYTIPVDQRLNGTVDGSPQVSVTVAYENSIRRTTTLITEPDQLVPGSRYVLFLDQVEPGVWAPAVEPYRFVIEDEVVRPLFSQAEAADATEAFAPARESQFMTAVISAARAAR